MGGKRSNDDHQNMCVCVIFSLQAQKIDCFDNKSSEKKSSCILHRHERKLCESPKWRTKPLKWVDVKPYNFCLINALRSYLLFSLSLSLNLAFIMPGTCIIFWFCFSHEWNIEQRNNSQHNFVAIYIWNRNLDCQKTEQKVDCFSTFNSI